MTITAWRELYGKVDEMYLDWFNNFLTVPRFAEYYQIGEGLADMIINEGRKRNA